MATAQDTQYNFSTLHQPYMSTRREEKGEEKRQDRPHHTTPHTTHILYNTLYIIISTSHDATRNRTRNPRSRVEHNEHSASITPVFHTQQMLVLGLMFILTEILIKTKLSDFFLLDDDSRGFFLLILCSCFNSIQFNSITINSQFQTKNDTRRNQ